MFQYPTRILALCLSCVILLADNAWGQGQPDPRAQDPGASAPSSIYLKVRHKYYRWQKDKVVELGGEIYYKVPLNFRVTKDLGDGRREESICDGRTAWSLTRSVERTVGFKYDVQRLLETWGRPRTVRFLLAEAPGLTFANPGKQPWDQELASALTLRYAGVEKINGVATQVYYTRPFRLWFGKEDGLLRKQVMVDEDDGSEIASTEAVKVEINPDIPDAKFRYEPPDGAAVYDWTDKMLENENPASPSTAGEGTNGEDENESAWVEWGWYALVAVVLGVVASGAAWLAIRRVRRQQKDKKDKGTP